MILDEMNAFIVLVQLQSTRKMTELLDLTQPAMTRWVQSLEASLGVVLFDRKTKPLKPTAMGSGFIDNASALVMNFRFYGNWWNKMRHTAACYACDHRKV